MKPKIQRVLATFLSGIIIIVLMSLFVSVIGVASVALLGFALDGNWWYVALYLVMGDLALSGVLILATIVSLSSRNLGLLR